MDTKSILSSKTIWGGVMMLAPTVLAWLGVSSADATHAIGNVQAMVSNGAELFGFAMVIWGRWTASKAVKLLG